MSVMRYNEGNIQGITEIIRLFAFTLSDPSQDMDACIESERKSSTEEEQIQRTANCLKKERWKGTNNGFRITTNRHDVDSE